MNHPSLFTFLAIAAFGIAVTAQAQHTPPVIVERNQSFYFALMPADWDGDGDLDWLGNWLAWPNPNLPAVSAFAWLENSGNGQLAEPVTLDSLFFYEAPILADFNGDNRQDLVYSRFPNGSLESLVIRLQLESGGFGPPVLQFPHTYFKNYDVADLDGDGDLDFLHTDNIALNWYENDGTGHFIEPPHFIDAPAGPVLHILDVNADGTPDILAVDPAAQTVYFFNNTGGGNFLAPTLATTLPDWLDHFIHADLDGDDLPDLLPVYRDDHILTSGQSWMRNLGDGQFAAPQALDPAAHWLHVVTGLAAGDIDLDGDTDIIAAMSRDSLVLFTNEGAGQFTAQLLATWPEILKLKGLAIGEFDGDGLPDLMAYSEGLPVYKKNLGGGQFGPKRVVLPRAQYPNVVEVADLDQNGMDDLISISGGEGRLDWYPNLGGGQFGPSRIISHTNYNGRLARSADLNGDGYPDIVSGIPKERNFEGFAEELIWYPNNGDGTLGEGIRVLPNNLYLPVHQMEIADMDGDGDMDIVCLIITATQSLALLRNNGAGGFGFPQFIVFNQPIYQFTLADIDGDADKDVLLNLGNGLNRLTNNGAGQFGAPVWISSEPWSSDPLFAEDLDSDGDKDIISGNRFWFSNLGNQTYSPAIPLNAYLTPSHFADLNNDGKPDLIGFHIYELGWQPNLGDGRFGEQIILRYIYNVGSTGGRGVDLDGDGNLEILYSWGGEIGYFHEFGGLPFVSGYCFLDENENGAQDSTEHVLPDMLIRLDPASHYAYSDANGQFRFYVMPGEYTLSFVPNNCWTLTTDSSSWHIAVSDTAITNRKFGFKPAAGSRRLETHLTSTPTICGRPAMFWLQTANRGCLPANGKIALVNSQSFELNWSTIAPHAIVGDTLFWQVNNLFPGEHFKVELSFNISVLPAGDTVQLAAFSETNGDDGITVELRHGLPYHSIVLCSYDPNDKLVDRAVLPVDYQPETGELAYTVRFQNTGNYLAFNVRIRDTLDAGLDWPTLRPLSASHDYFTNIDSENGIVEFNFPNILLPDSTSNEPLSHGFVAFAIKPKAGLAAGRVIPNRAGIYFDYNPPVITDYAETRINTVVSVRPEKRDHKWVHFFPNPASAVVNLRFPHAQGNVRVRLFDMQGRLCMERSLLHSGFAGEFSVAGLAPAAYLLEVSNENGEMNRAVLLVQR